MTLRGWLHDERKHITKRFELRERVFEALRSAGVDLPFETINHLTFFPEGQRAAS